MIYIISDTHFFHKNIIKYCNRPYENTYYMNKDLIERWNSVVQDNDVVLHLGDFAMSRKRNDVKEIASQLKGKISLVKGNHDNFDNNFYCEIFNGCYDSLVIDNMFFTHKPYEHLQFTDFSINVHGHIHNNIPDAYSLDPELYFNVSCEVIDYKPIAIDTLYKRKEQLQVK